MARVAVMGLPWIDRLSFFTLWIAFALVPPTLRADTFIGYASRAAFGGNDALNWGQVGICNQNVTNPVVVTSATGLVVTASQALGHPSESVQINPGATGGCLSQGIQGFYGHFAAGDNLLATGSFGVGGGGPETLSFGKPIAGVGMQIETSCQPCTFVAELDAYNGTTLLFSITGNGQNLNGGSSSFGNNTALFLGLDDLGGPNITSLVISIPFASAGPGTVPFGEDFAINQLSLADATSVPEPSILLLLGTGLLGVLGMARRKWLG